MFSFSLLPRGLSSVLSDVLNRVPSASFFTKRCATIPPIYAKPWERPYGEVSGLPESIGKVTAPDVRVRVRGGVVAVEVECAVVLVLVVVAADIQHNARGVVVAVVVQDRIPIAGTPTTGGIAPNFDRRRRLTPAVFRSFVILFCVGLPYAKGAAAPSALPFRGVFGDGTRRPRPRSRRRRCR